ncbi:MAG: hypothetical protein PHP35_02600, partial [Candidatus Colwellbacteria bacterium]|nr:hypothetical protein [Candidatus Colwellbacteria bacterium]
KLIDIQTGAKDTRHNPNPVPLYIIDNRLRRERSKEETEENEKMIIGSLCDIAPTVLALMGLEKPVEMTGQNLLPAIK